MQYPEGRGSCNHSMRVHTALAFPSTSQWNSVLDGTVRVRMQFRCSNCSTTPTLKT